MNIVIESFNPYAARYRDLSVVSRESIWLAKQLRLAGWTVQLGSEAQGTRGVVFRKGIGQVLHDPLFLTIFETVASIPASLVSDWIADLLRRYGKPVDSSLPGTSVVIKVSKDGRTLHYDQRGHLLDEVQVKALTDLMLQRQRDYADSLTIPPPNLQRPFPVYLDHTSRVVGWTSFTVKGGRTLINPKFFDRETLRRLGRGELNGFSIAGIALESHCRTCNSDYTLCNHGATCDDPCENEIRKHKLCDISVVRDPVNDHCRFENWILGNE